MHRLIRLTAAAGTAALLAACSAAAQPTPRFPSPSPTPTDPVHLHGTLALSGDYGYTVQFSAGATLQPSQRPAPTCAAYATASAGASGFSGPVVEVSTPRPIYLTVVLRDGYHGPGTYTLSSDPSLEGTAAISIPTAEGFSVQTYHSTDASPMTLTVRADGSGVFSFEQWRTDEVRGTFIAGHLSGTASWTCSGPS